MPYLQANNISHQFSNGDAIFENLSCAMTDSRVGLIGSNGAGKSLLASMLLKLAAPYKGTVSEPKSFVFYQQQTDTLHILSRAARIENKCSDLVPQQPPIIFAPLLRAITAYFAINSGVPS